MCPAIVNAQCCKHYHDFKGQRLMKVHPNYTIVKNLQEKEKGKKKNEAILVDLILKNFELKRIFIKDIRGKELRREEVMSSTG